MVLAASAAVAAVAVVPVADGSRKLGAGSPKPGEKSSKGCRMLEAGSPKPGEQNPKLHVYPPLAGAGGGGENLEAGRTKLGVKLCAPCAFFVNFVVLVSSRLSGKESSSILFCVPCGGKEGSWKLGIRRAKNFGTLLESAFRIHLASLITPK